jgi:hypothetical protein
MLKKLFIIVGIYWLYKKFRSGSSKDMPANEDTKS